MNQQSRKPGLGRRSPHSVGELITDPAELQRLEAAMPPNDGGVERMVIAALEIAGDRAASRSISAGRLLPSFESSTRINNSRSCAACRTC